MRRKYKLQDDFIVDSTNEIFLGCVEDVKVDRDIFSYHEALKYCSTKHTPEMLIGTRLVYSDIYDTAYIDKACRVRDDNPRIVTLTEIVSRHLGSIIYKAKEVSDDGKEPKSMYIAISDDLSVLEGVHGYAYAVRVSPWHPDYVSVREAYGLGILEKRFPFMSNISRPNLKFEITHTRSELKPVDEFQKRGLVMTHYRVFSGDDYTVPYGYAFKDDTIYIASGPLRHDGRYYGPITSFKFNRRKK